MHHQCVDFVSFERLPLVFKIKSWVRHRDGISLNVCVWHVDVLRLFVAQQYLLWNNHSPSIGTPSPNQFSIVLFTSFTVPSFQLSCVLNFKLSLSTERDSSSSCATSSWSFSDTWNTQHISKKASNIRCVRACISMANKCDVYVPYPSTHYGLLIHHSCPSLLSCIFVVSWWLIEVLSSCEP